MTTFNRQAKNTALVGMTPVPKYVIWADHRDAMRQEAAARRTAMERRLAKTVSNHQPSV